MEYRVIKAINNNVVLARDGAGEQIVLMSKGIGFGRRRGDTVSDQTGGNQIFKLWNPENGIKSIQYDQKKLAGVVGRIAQLAAQRFGISAQQLEKTLLDHISFSIDRLNFGLPLDVPFQDEISILYAREYELGREAVELVRDQVGIDLGEGEIDLIALHLNSARRQRPLSRSMKDVAVYNRISALLSSRIPGADTKVFLLSLNALVKASLAKNAAVMPAKEAVFEAMPQSTALAREIGTMIESELQLALSDDAVGYLAVDLERLKQSVE